MSALEAESDDYSPVEEPVSRCLEIPYPLAGKRLDAALAGLLPEYSRSRIQAWLKDASILVDGEVADAKAKVHGGEQVVLVLPDKSGACEHVAEDIAFPVVYEDDALLVIDKPAGLVVHPGSGNPRGTLLNGLLHHAPALAALPRVGIVHRLDKDTSGLMVVAKTLTVQTDLVRQLQSRSVKRHYLALVHGQPADRGTIDAPISRHPSQRTRMAVVPGGRESRTHYETLERFTKCALVECRLDTGRTHQIRVHMASIAHPLIGDPTYGGRRRSVPVLDDFPRQALHARRLGLIHPVSGEAMEWHSPLPDDFARLLDALRTGMEDAT